MNYDEIHVICLMLKTFHLWCFHFVNLLNFYVAQVNLQQDIGKLAQVFDDLSGNTGTLTATQMGQNEDVFGPLLESTPNSFMNIHKVALKKPSKTVSRQEFLDSLVDVSF